MVPALVAFAVGGARGASTLGAVVGTLRAAPRRALICQAATAAMPSKGRATRTTIPGRGPALGGGSATRLRWVARYISGGLVEMLLVWLDRPSSLDAKELIKLFERMTAGVLGGLGEARPA